MAREDAALNMVMDEGDIVEQGAHEDLLAREGFHAELYNSQVEYAEANGVGIQEPAPAR